MLNLLRLIIVLWLCKNIFTPRKYTLKYLRVNRKKFRSKEPGCVQLSLSLGKIILFLEMIICIILLLLNLLLLSKFFPNKTF